MKKKSDEPIELSEKDFSFVCPLQTEDMTVVEGGYFCGECKQKVHDVSGMTKDEYSQLVSKTENVCVTFKKVATVSLVLSLAACATESNNTKKLTGFPFEMKNDASKESNASESNNSLAPYNAVDKKKNIRIIRRTMGKPIRKNHQSTTKPKE